MAIVNRDLDVSEQKLVLNAAIGLATTGTSLPVAVVPYPGIIRNIQVAALGLSGSPSWTFQIHRFIPGTGFTAIACAGALTVANYGTSGIQGVSLVASGSTLLNVIANDVISIATATANTASLYSAVSVAIQATQDVKAVYGSAS